MNVQDRDIERKEGKHHLPKHEVILGTRYATCVNRIVSYRIVSYHTLFCFLSVQVGISGIRDNSGWTSSMSFRCSRCIFEHGSTHMIHGPLCLGLFVQLTSEWFSGQLEWCCEWFPLPLLAPQTLKARKKKGSERACDLRPSQQTNP